MMTLTRLVSAVAVIVPVPVYAAARNLLQVDPETSALIGLAAQIPLVFLFMWFYNRMDEKQRQERQDTQALWTSTVEKINTAQVQANDRLVLSNREWIAQVVERGNEQHSAGMARLGDILASNTQALTTVGETLRQVSKQITDHDTWEREVQSKSDIVIELLQEERRKRNG